MKLYCFVPPAEGLVTVFYIRIISKQKIFDSFICFFQLEDKTTWDVVLWKLRSSILYLNQQIRWISFILLFCSICFLIHLDFFFRWNSRYGMFNIVCWLKIFEVFYLLVFKNFTTILLLLFIRKKIQKLPHIASLVSKSL